MDSCYNVTILVLVICRVICAKVVSATSSEGFLVATGCQTCELSEMGDNAVVTKHLFIHAQLEEAGTHKSAKTHCFCTS